MSVTEPAEEAAGLKRKLPEDFAVGPIGKENIAPDMSHRRRPAEDSLTGKRPVTLKEARDSISFLLEEPHMQVPDSQVSDASDDDLEIEDGDRLPHMRQTRNDGNGPSVLTVLRASVVNRLTLSRQNSLAQDEDTQTSGPVAFHTPTSNGGTFKVPSLLRRATTNLSNASSNEGSRTTTPSNENAVRMGRSKKSNIHFQAREAERMKKVREADMRRKEGIRKSVTGKARVSVLGNSLGGRNTGFE